MAWLRRASTPVVALLAMGAWSIGAGAVGAGLLATADDGGPPAASTLAGTGVTPGRAPASAPSDDGTGAYPTQEPSPTDFPTPTNDPTPTDDPTPTTDPGVPTEYVSGPAGLTTVAPVGWTPKSTKSTGTVERFDPADPGRFVRYGAVRSAGNVYSPGNYFAQTPTVHGGYQQYTLTTTTFHGRPAAEWEFEFDKQGGGRRHAHALYWEAGGMEYVVYASSTADRWTETASIFAAMVATATP
jgi:hypothetical protein